MEMSYGLFEKNCVRILKKTETAMMNATYGDLITEELHMLHLNEAMDHFAMSIRICWYDNVFGLRMVIS